MILRPTLLSVEWPRDMHRSDGGPAARGVVPAEHAPHAGSDRALHGGPQLAALQAEVPQSGAEEHSVLVQK